MDLFSLTINVPSTDYRQTLGALLSLVSAFFNFIPFLISPSRADLSLVCGGGVGASGTAPKAGGGGAKFGGGGGAKLGGGGAIVGGGGGALPVDGGGGGIADVDCPMSNLAVEVTEAVDILLSILLFLKLENTYKNLGLYIM